MKKMVVPRKDLPQQQPDVFRSGVQTRVVSTTALDRSVVTGHGPGEGRVSRYGLEQYLNACSPTCHG